MDTPETPVIPPKLPPELERIVFEMTARTYPAGILPLMLVAWRVKSWVEPFLYRVVHLSPYPNGRQHYGFPLMPLETLLKIVLNKESSDDPKFRSFCEAVEYVFLEEILIDPISPILDAILMACPKITDFFTRRPIGSNLEALASLTCLRRLAIDTYNLFSNSSPITPIAPAAANFAHPLFRNLTHLELIDLPARSGSLRRPFYAQLVLIPELTHISFNSAALAIGIHPTLVKIKKLQCIVILGLPLRPHESELNSSSLVPDDRFVYIRQTDFQRDWFDCAKGGGGYWGIAEMFLAARRKGDIDREHSVVLHCSAQ
ncbi:hypothetical protein R3P38DRAFT_2844072 [Favolaschia claudopus]|uniref:Uncharacterized protein n=1 Tax=Favolaschia claudopus TaxID=2862362 RepID=A0AAW0E2M7_9AGAR